MNKEKVLDYVMNSPGNTNRAVLSGMLDESSDSKLNNRIWHISITNNSVYSDHLVDYISDSIINSPLLYCIEYNNKFYLSFNNIDIPTGTTILKMHILSNMDNFSTYPNSGIISAVSGNATLYQESGEVKITGDCSIILSDDE